MRQEFYSRLTGLEKDLAKAKGDLERAQTAHDKKTSRYNTAMETAPAAYDKLSSTLRSYLFENENPDPRFIGAVLDLYDQINQFSNTNEIPGWIREYADDLRSTHIEDDNTPVKKKRRKTRPKKVKHDYFEFEKRMLRSNNQNAIRILDNLGIEGRTRSGYAASFARKYGH